MERRDTLFVPERRRSRRAATRDPRGRDVRAADLQEKLTKRVRLEKIGRDSHFVGFDEDGGTPANIAASGASQQAQRAKRAKQSNRIARRRAEEERRDTLFVPERRRSRRAATRDPR
jgi:hypothetical protein